MTEPNPGLHTGGAEIRPRVWELRQFGRRPPPGAEPHPDTQREPPRRSSAPLGPSAQSRTSAPPLPAESSRAARPPRSAPRGAARPFPAVSARGRSAVLARNSRARPRRPPGGERRTDGAAPAAMARDPAFVLRYLAEVEELAEDVLAARQQVRPGPAPPGPSPLLSSHPFPSRLSADRRSGREAEPEPRGAAGAAQRPGARG